MTVFEAGERDERGSERKGEVVQLLRKPFGRGAVLAVALAVLWSSAGRSVELGGFFEHTLYTQEGEPAEDYKSRVLLMLHGFKSAMPNNDYGVIHEAFGEAHTVAGYNYDYVNVPANVSDLDELAALLKDRRVIVIGTSLGGFWADYMAKRFQIDGAILVNPAVRPDQTMQRHLGKQHSKKRMSDFMVTEAAVQAYRQLDQPDQSDARRLVLLCKDDEVLDYRNASEVFKGEPDTQTVVFEEGGHNLPLERRDVMAAIRGFIEETWND